MFPSRRRKLVAVMIGVVLGGAPLLGFNVWLGRVIDRQGEDDVQLIAKRAVSIVEARLGRVLASVDSLAARGVDSCEPDHLEVMRETAFMVSPVKEFAVTGADGESSCTQLGVPLSGRRVLASIALPERPDVVLEVVRFEARPDSMLRVRRTGPNGTGIAALVPADMLMPQTGTAGGSFNGYLKVAAPDGTVIVESGAALLSASAEDMFASTQHNERFGIASTVMMPKAFYRTGGEDLRLIGSVVSGGIGIAILALAILLSMRQPADPVEDLERAIANNEFVPYYQPIVDIRSAKLLGAEVLARWCRPDGSVVSPGTFIPLVEQSGLIVALTRDLMRQACVDIGEAYALRPDMKVSFNLTAQHFADEKVVSDVRRIFGRSKIRLSQVVLELTERQPVHNLVTTRRVIAALQGLGCQVALDDVGTGHSGLSSILKLGVDIIKIDKLFVDSIGTEHKSATIVETLVDLARNMSMEVVAEGVERFEQIVDLRNRGIRAAQGYVFAPPLPASAFVRLVEAIEPSTGEAPVEATQSYFPVRPRLAG